MPKPVPLTPAVMEAPVTPQTAPPASGAQERGTAPKSKVGQIPLQLRLPRDEVRAIKVAAAEREQTISDFMLACYHAFMQVGPHACRQPELRRARNHSDAMPGFAAAPTFLPPSQPPVSAKWPSILPVADAGANVTTSAHSMPIRPCIRALREFTSHCDSLGKAAEWLRNNCEA